MQQKFGQASTREEGNQLREVVKHAEGRRNMARVVPGLVRILL